MDNLQVFFATHDLKDPDNLDGLLALADLVRQELDCGGTQIEAIIRTCIADGYPEAFSWVLSILQEVYERGTGKPDLICELGGQIPDFDGFTRQLQTEKRAWKNEVESILDEHGEVQSFFNIFTYKTGYNNIYLISAENFDTKDNDFIRYKLLVTEA